MAYAYQFRVAFLIILALYCAQLLRPLWLSRFRKRIWILVTSIIILGNFLLAYVQYRTWNNNPVGKFLLPPYQSWAYFIKYSSIEFFAPYIVSGLIAVIVVGSVVWLNNRFDRRFFYSDEYLLIGINTLVVGHPGWLVYALVSLVFYMAWNIVATIFNKGAVRVSMYYMWLPLGCSSLLLSQWLIRTVSWLKVLIL